MRIILFGILLSFFSGRNEGFAQKKRPLLLAGIFDGRTPCRELAGQLEEEVTGDCLKIKWRLILFKDSITGAPANFELTGFRYRKEKPFTGTWRITRGMPADPNAIVYELSGGAKNPLNFLKADENILFFLDRKKNLLVGNRDFSYTLNRRPG